jgi:hypothetical protein
MASIIKVDKLTGKSGTDASAPIILSGDTATLGTGATIGSGVTFPSGHVLQCVENKSDSSFFFYGTEVILHCTCDITIKKAGSSLLVIAAPALYSPGSATRYVEIKLRSKNSSGRSSTLGDYGEIVNMGQLAQGDGEWTMIPSVIHKYAHGQSVDTVINVAVSGRETGGSDYNMKSNHASSYSSMSIFEIG